MSDWSSFKTFAEDPLTDETVNNNLSDKKPAASLLQSEHYPWPLPQDGPDLCCFYSSTSFLVNSGNKEFSLSRGQRHCSNYAIGLLHSPVHSSGTKARRKKNQNRIARTFFYKSICLCWNGGLGHWQTSIAQGSPSTSPVWTSEM